MTTARTPTSKKADILMFVQNARAFNRKAPHIIEALQSGHESVTAPASQELIVALDQLAASLKTLRMSTEGAAPASGFLHASTFDGAAGARKEVVFGSNEEMAAKGHLVSPLEFQTLMGWTTRQAVWKAVASNRVFYLTHKSKRWYPAFFGDPSFERKQLEAVSKALGDLPGGAKLQFFLTRKGSLAGEVPLQALAEGRVAKVLDIVTAFAENREQT
jgi:hypothetical protein